MTDKLIKFRFFEILQLRNKSLIKRISLGDEVTRS